MKQYILIILSLLSTIAFSQSDSTRTDSVICIVSVEAEFPGGQNAMMNFCNENFEYPKESINNGEQGVIWIEFHITETGTVENVKIVRGVSELLDNEAIRVIKSMPNWSPAIKKGKAVRSKFSIPITAKLT